MIANQAPEEERTDLPTEEQVDDWEERGMCPICSYEQDKDVPVPKRGCSCGYGIESTPVNLRDCEVKRTFIGHGVVLYALFVPEFVGPVGMVWGHEFSVQGKGVFQVIYAFTLPDARRQGVRREIEKHIFHMHEFISTGEGSDEGGLAYLRRMGYTQDELTKMWVRKKDS